MNITTSEYSSGCESGWTMYLDQLSNSTHHHHHDDNHNFVTDFEEQKGADVINSDDEDLSMVSDASSGPPPPNNYNLNDDEIVINSCGGVYSQYYGYDHTHDNSVKNKGKSSKEAKGKKHHTLCLDDTASSPLFAFSQDNVSPSNFSSQVFSSEHLEDEKSITKKRLGFFKSSTKGKSGSLLGRKRP